MTIGFVLFAGGVLFLAWAICRAAADADDVMGER